MAKIKLPDNQELELPDEIAKDDEQLRNALAPYAPDVRNAKLTRSTKDGVMTVTVVKQAGTLGIDPIEALLKAPSHLNPAIVMHQKLAEERPGLAELLLQKPEIDRAIKVGTDEVREAGRSCRSLIDSDAIPSESTPKGF